MAPIFGETGASDDVNYVNGMTYWFVNAIMPLLFSHRDRFRTTVNVLGDSIGAGVVEHLSRGDLRKYDGCNGAVDDTLPLSNNANQDKPDDPHEVFTSAL